MTEKELDLLWERIRVHQAKVLFLDGDGGSILDITRVRLQGSIDENKRLHEENKQLVKENWRLTEENRRLTEENRRIKPALQYLTGNFKFESEDNPTDV